MVVLDQSRDSDIDHLAVRLEDAHLAAVLDHLDGDSVGLVRLRVEQRYVGNMDGHVLIDDPAGLAFHRVGPLVLLHPVYALYEKEVLVDAAQDGSALALVAPGDDDDAVALTYPFHVQCSLQGALQNFRRQRYDLHEPLGTQFARHRPEDARADRLELGGEQHRRVGIEADQRPVGAPHAFGGAHHDGVVDLALIHTPARRGVFDGHFDHVTNAGIAALGAAQHLYAHH